jgi:hypothetical protein
MVQVDFNTNQYEFSHGHSPRGRGSWAFEIEGRKEIFWTPGNTLFGEAKKMAKAEAVKILQGHTTTGKFITISVKVLS